MQETTLPLQLLTTGSSIVIVFLIFYTLFQYKKKISFIQELIAEKENGNFTAQDKEFLKITFNETSHYRDKIVKIGQILYPVFILIAGVFFIFFEFKEALTHINVVVVAFLYLHILKKNINNYLNQMNLLASK